MPLRISHTLFYNILPVERRLQQHPALNCFGVAQRSDMHIQPADHGFKVNVLMLLRLNMLHLLQAVSPNSIGLDMGVPARGWRLSVPAGPECGLVRP